MTGLLYHNLLMGVDLAAFAAGKKEHRRNPASRWYVILLFSPVCETELGHAKKYDIIVKGFKVLEASHEELQRKSTATEERLLTIDAAHAALIAEMEAAQRVLRDCKTVQ